MNYNKYYLFLFKFFFATCWFCCSCAFIFAQSENSSPVISDSLRVAQINIFGNKVTKEKIIIRELSFKEGGKIAKENIEVFFEQEENKLRNTNLFITHDINWYPTMEGDIVVNIFLKERWYTFPIPLIELADRSFNEWWTNQNRDLSRIEYGLNFKRKNFRGRKEDLGLLLQFGFTTQLRLLYRIPFLDKKQSLGLTLRTSFSQNNNIAYNTIGNRLQNVGFDRNHIRQRFNFGFTLTKRIGFYDFHNLAVQYNNISVDDTVAYLNPNYFLNGNTRQRYFHVTYNYRHDYRDFSAYPLTGSFFNLQFEKIGVGIFDDVNTFILRGNYAKYLKIKGKLYYSSSVSAKVSLPEVQPYVNLRGLGYRQNFVRGYDLYVIEGQHFALQKNTFRFKFLDKRLDAGKVMPIDQFSTVPIEMYFKTYFDVGYVRNTRVDFFNEALSNKPLWGTGFGVDLVTFYNAVMRFEYSFNSRNESGFFLYFSSDL